MNEKSLPTRSPIGTPQPCKSYGTNVSVTAIAWADGVMRTDRIVVLTGSGISAESGIATFRDPDGIWAKLDYRDVATPEALECNPKLVHEFYNVRRRGALTAKPNAAHLALVRREQAMSAGVGGSFTLVTQNIDPLHDRAAFVDRILAAR